MLTGHLKLLETRFKQISRQAREHLLCAMIRINYGTPWQGDQDIVQAFLPKHNHLMIGQDGLIKLIDFLSPYSEEPTESGLPQEDLTLRHDLTTMT